MVDKNIHPRLMLWLYRFILGLWFFKILADPFYQLSLLPQSAWVQIGLLSHIPLDIISWLWSRPALWTLKITILMALALSFFIKNRCLLIFCGLLLTVQQSLIRGLGDINHSDIASLLIFYMLMIMPPYLMTENSNDQDRMRTSYVRAMAWILVTPYCLIAAHRLLNGFTVFDPAAMSSWLVHLSLRPSWFGFECGAQLAEHQWVVQILSTGFLLITLLELLTPFCMVNLKFRWIWIIVMIPFHVSTLFLMNIFFWENIIFLTLFFYPLRHEPLSKQPTQQMPTQKNKVANAGYRL